ncbi:unnamed protein product [Paramecium pentaurelia]|uniref:Uncharacterized protein n=1 Tax=Paramecium pentaurelia TaxID=43138 RepID=A0A8S1TEF4_9CILI|nr:unnamed protein product [Paramecium pentaurelia]
MLFSDIISILSQAQTIYNISQQHFSRSLIYVIQRSISIESLDQFIDTIQYFVKVKRIKLIYYLGISQHNQEKEIFLQVQDMIQHNLIIFKMLQAIYYLLDNNRVMMGEFKKYNYVKGVLYFHHDLLNNFLCLKSCQTLQYNPKVLNHFINSNSKKKSNIDRKFVHRISQFVLHKRNMWQIIPN